MLALPWMQHVDFSSPEELDLRRARAYAHKLPHTLTCRRIQPPAPRSASTSTVMLLGTWQAMRRYLMSMRPSSIGAILLKVSACKACRYDFTLCCALGRSCIACSFQHASALRNYIQCILKDAPLRRYPAIVSAPLHSRHIH